MASLGNNELTSERSTDALELIYHQRDKAHPVCFVPLVIQSIKKFILASLLFNRFMKDVRIGLLQLNMIYEGQSTSASY